MALALLSLTTGPNPDLSSGLMKTNTHFCCLFVQMQLFHGLQHFCHGRWLNDSCSQKSEVLFILFYHVRAKITCKQHRKDFLTGTFTFFSISEKKCYIQSGGCGSERITLPVVNTQFHTSIAVINKQRVADFDNIAERDGRATS